MTLLLVLVGSLLLVIVFTDAVVTTLVAGAGGGPVTQLLSRRLWRMLLRASRLAGGRFVLTVGGPLVLLGTVLVWVAMLWAGWSAIFLAGEASVVESNSRTPATTVQTIYFAGFTVFTLGIGDYVPSGDGWELLTAVASFGGLFLVTLSITYLLSVVTAVVSGRRFAASLHLYGETGADVLLLHVADGSLDESFSDRLGSLAEEVVASAQQQLAYPVLHFFRATDERSSTPRALAALDDVLLLASEGLTPELRPPDHVLTPLRRSLDFYVQTVEAGTVRSTEKPPAPDLTPLRKAGLAVVSDEQFAAAVEERSELRVGMRRLLVSDARAWPTGAVAS